MLVVFDCIREIVDVNPIDYRLYAATVKNRTMHEVFEELSLLNKNELRKLFHLEAQFFCHNLKNGSHLSKVSKPIAENLFSIMLDPNNVKGTKFHML